jgi:hypothetical protein
MMNVLQIPCRFGASDGLQQVHEAETWLSLLSSSAQTTTHLQSLLFPSPIHMTVSHRHPCLRLHEG